MSRPPGASVGKGDTSKDANGMPALSLLGLCTGVGGSAGLRSQPGCRGTTAPVLRAGPAGVQVADGVRARLAKDPLAHAGLAGELSPRFCPVAGLLVQDFVAPG